MAHWAVLQEPAQGISSIIINEKLASAACNKSARIRIPSFFFPFLGIIIFRLSPIGDSFPRLIQTRIV